jgi:hypothetical protein
VKLVIVINGRGGVGKDTVCGVLADHYKVRNASSIAPIKEIALRHGWGGGKDDRDRKFLSDLKNAFSAYNDLPYRYMLGELDEFLASDAEIMCVHIREMREIAKFVAGAKKALGKDGRVATLLVRRPSCERVYGNGADDGVGEFDYDWTYDNSGPLEDIDGDFMDRFAEWLKR